MAVSNPPGFKYLMKHNGARYLSISFLILLAGVTLSIINWQSVKQRDYATTTTKYNQELNQSKAIITTTLGHYSALLGEGAGLLSVDSNNIDQSAWLSFFQSQNLTTGYPGVAGVDFAQYVPSGQLSNYLNSMVNQGQSGFTITPAGTRNVYVPATYLGYTSPVSLQVLGLDQLSIPARKAAIMQALNSGSVTMSSKVTLLAYHKGEPGFIIYQPVYSSPSSTQAERQSSITGFVYIVIDSPQFFTALLSHYMGPGVALRIYDGSTTSSNLLYQSPGFANTVRSIKKPLSSTVAVTFGDKTWNIRVIIAQGLLQSVSDQSALTELFGGLVVSLLVAGVVWYFTYYRGRKLLWQQQMEVQSAKDELLSLAAHQLRTPATIVKQYLGILLQNFAGDLPAQQRKIIQIAYDSNEHQLRIANQFLDVARLESGRIKLVTKPLVVNTMLQVVVDEQREIAKVRRQKISYKNPKKVYKVPGDAKYLPMVFENLLSNAIKYSGRGSVITVELHQSGLQLYISVNDHGIGIPLDEQAGIFEKFTRVSSKESDSQDGTGIGLHLAKQIVTLHKGEIRVESVVGKGSTFTVVLPMQSNKRPKPGMQRGPRIHRAGH